ncbi:MAG TPA: magnesium transporter [Chloroflexaceae bacterium]|nr:magnesium transporter [Chloroflexaceae bacterium]
MATVVSLEQLETQVRATLEDGRLDELRGLLAEHHPADIADVIDRLDDDEQARVFGLLPPDQAADVLSETDLDATRALVRKLSPEAAAALFQLMSTDDVVEILGEDIPEAQQALLRAMAPGEARDVRRHLAFPARSAGRLMTEGFVRVAAEQSAADGLAALRQAAPEVETLSDLYVLDGGGRLTGVVTLRALLVAPPEQPLGAIATEPEALVTPDTDQEQVARLVSQYDLLAIPVVTAGGVMLGVVTIDDVVDVLVQEGSEDVLRLGAVQEGATDESYFTTPIRRTIGRRVGWLMILFLTGTFTVNVLGWFEGALEQIVALSFFIPLLIGTGGNTGAQTVSTMVRSLAVGEIRPRDLWRVVGRELLSGLLLGALLGAAAFGLALLLGNGADLALVVGLTVVAICTWANTIGAMVPLLAYRLGLDPALVSAPLITTLVDATGLAIYLLIASSILGL